MYKEAYLIPHKLKSGKTVYSMIPAAEHQPKPQEGYHISIIGFLNPDGEVPHGYEINSDPVEANSPEKLFEEVSVLIKESGHPNKDYVVDVPVEKEPETEVKKEIDLGDSFIW